MITPTMIFQIFIDRTYRAYKNSFILIFVKVWNNNILKSFRFLIIYGPNDTVPNISVGRFHFFYMNGMKGEIRKSASFISSFFFSVELKIDHTFVQERLYFFMFLKTFSMGIGGDQKIVSQLLLIM